jgi:hypothetical protein
VSGAVRLYSNFRGRRPTYVGYGLRPHRLDRLKVQGGNLGSTNAASA